MVDPMRPRRRFSSLAALIALAPATALAAPIDLTPWASIEVDRFVAGSLGFIELEAGPLLEHWDKHKTAGDADFGWLHQAAKS